MMATTFVKVLHYKLPQKNLVETLRLGEADMWENSCQGVVGKDSFGVLGQLQSSELVTECSVSLCCLQAASVTRTS